MGTIRDAFSSLTAVRAALPQIIEQAVRDSEREVIAVQQDQMFEGIAADGFSIGTYAPITQQIKRSKGQPTDRVTGYDTGSMYRGMQMVVGSGRFAVLSKSATFGPFTDRYGDHVFGISPAYADDVKEAVMPRIIQEVKQQTGFQ